MLEKDSDCFEIKSPTHDFERVARENPNIRKIIVSCHYREMSKDLLLFPNLTEVVFRTGFDYQYNILELCQLKQLRSLSIVHAVELPKVFFEKLADMQSLRSLTFEGSHDISDDDLKYIGKLHHLQFFSMDGNPISEKGIKHLLPLKELNSLSFNRCEISEYCLRTLAPLGPQLEELMLIMNGSHISDRGLKIIGKFTNIKKLLLDDDYKKSANGFLSLSGLTQLEEVHLNSFTGNPQTFAMLSQFTHLRKLTLHGNGDADSKYLATLVHLTDLDVRFYLESGNEITGALPFLENLQSLAIGSFGDIRKEDLARLEHLTFLNLSRYKDNNERLSLLSSLKGLTHLDLHYSEELTDEGIGNLAEISNLKNLDLSYCPKISGEGFARFHQLKKLVSINLEYCDELSDEALKNLSMVESLQEINLIRCAKITDQGLNYLLELKNLKWINLRLCHGTTYEGRRRLAKKNVAVIYIKRLQEVYE